MNFLDCPFSVDGECHVTVPVMTHIAGVHVVEEIDCFTQNAPLLYVKI